MINWVAFDQFVYIDDSGISTPYAMDSKSVYRNLNIFLLCIGFAPFLQSKTTGHFLCKKRYVIAICSCLVIYLIVVTIFCYGDVARVYSEINKSFANKLNLIFAWVKIFGYGVVVLLAVCNR